MPIGRAKACEVRTTEPGAEIFDLAKALEQTEGDKDLLRELIIIFSEESGELMAQLQSAIAAGNCDSIRKAAHRLKGAAAAVGGARISSIARELETMGATGYLSTAASTWEQLRTQVEKYGLATVSFGREPQ